MPYLRVAVAFTAAAAAALRAQLGAGWDRPRAMFTLEPLRATGMLPCAGDLVADLRLTDRVWRVEQRLLLVDQQANARATCSSSRSGSSCGLAPTTCTCGTCWTSA